MGCEAERRRGQRRIRYQRKSKWNAASKYEIGKALRAIQMDRVEERD